MAGAHRCNKVGASNVALRLLESRFESSLLLRPSLLLEVSLRCGNCDGLGLERGLGSPLKLPCPGMGQSLLWTRLLTWQTLLGMVGVAAQGLQALLLPLFLLLPLPPLLPHLLP